MIVDDEPVNAKVVRKYLQGAGYQNFALISDATCAMDAIKTQRPDIVLLDIVMPQLSGLTILDMVRHDPAVLRIPVVILTASGDAATKLEALSLGATDFLAKPVEPSELIARLRNTLLVKAHQDQLSSYSAQLEHEVRLRTAELEASRRAIIHCLASAAECRDDVTGFHIIRVGMYAAIIARHLGFGPAMVELIEEAAKLHDVGKIGIPDAILLKPGKLTAEEYEAMKKHCELGERIIQPEPVQRPASLLEPRAPSDTDKPSIITLAAEIALSHHERWDGKGYPRRLAGEAIPLVGRITSVADVFDALSSQRPYKPAFDLAKCFDLLEEGRGTQFDPRVLDAFFASSDQIVRVMLDYHDHEA